MPRWRATAIEHLPDLRKTIAAADSIMALWIEITGAFEKAYREPRNEDLIARIYAYATWCWHAPRHGDAGRDPSTAATVAFLEHIPAIPAAREDMPRWFTFDEITASKSIFVYSIGEIAFKDLLAHMQRNQHRHSKRPRLLPENR
jgi:hypothetical protein